MTIQTKISDGENVNTKIYRKVYKHKNLAEYREGFFCQQEHSQWGIMVQLRGDERIKLASFGDVPNHQNPIMDNYEGNARMDVVIL